MNWGRHYDRQESASSRNLPLSAKSGLSPLWCGSSPAGHDDNISYEDLKAALENSEKRARFLGEQVSEYAEQAKRVRSLEKEREAQLRAVKAAHIQQQSYAALKERYEALLLLVEGQDKMPRAQSIEDSSASAVERQREAFEQEREAFLEERALFETERRKFKRCCRQLERGWQLLKARDSEKKSAHEIDPQLLHRLERMEFSTQSLSSSSQDQQQNLSQINGQLNALLSRFQQVETATREASIEAIKAAAIAEAAKASVPSKPIAITRQARETRVRRERSYKAPTAPGSSPKSVSARAGGGGMLAGLVQQNLKIRKDP
jgi:hypothetical protein